MEMELFTYPFPFHPTWLGSVKGGKIVCPHPLVLDSPAIFHGPPPLGEGGGTSLQ